MRIVPFFAALAISILAISAAAEEHRVPRNALAQLGLGDLKTVPQQRGLEVRGRGSRSLAMGLSVVSGILLDTETGSFVVGGDANSAMSLAENIGSQAPTEVSTEQSSSSNISLEVITLNSSFSGLIYSAAGGAAFARGR